MDPTLKRLTLALITLGLAACSNYSSDPFEEVLIPNSPQIMKSQDLPTTETTKETQVITLKPITKQLIQKAREYAIIKNFDAAYVQLERALNIEPNNPIVWFALAKTQRMQGQGAKAQAMANKALSLVQGDKALQRQIEMFLEK